MTDMTDAEILETMSEHITPETLVTGWGADGGDAGCVLHHVAKADQMTLDMGHSKEHQVFNRRPGVVKALHKAMFPKGSELKEEGSVVTEVYGWNDTTNYEEVLRVTKEAITLLDEGA